MGLSEENNRLPINFHKTFVPERRYIHSILQYAFSGKKGDVQEISDVTGIPTGKSSGKVMPSIDYCIGMGLITLPDSSKRKAIKEPILTHFGRIVLQEDPFLTEPLTQWIAHLYLCGPVQGADVWYHVFFKGTQTLGSSFEKSRLETYLQNIYGSRKTNLIGPLVRMYQDPASFSACGALKEQNGLILLESAPTRDEYVWAYGAWMLGLMEMFYPGESQVTITDLDRVAGWRTIPGWGIDQSYQILGLLEKRGVLIVERHMNPWMVQRLSNSQQLWSKIYDELI